MNVLIGYTGFIGSSLNQNQFHLKLNSKNWQDISEPIEADRVVITAPSGLKYKANQNPIEDLCNCLQLFQQIATHFKSIKELILISTNDALNPDTAYGTNRRYLKDLLLGYCNNLHISMYIFYLGMTFGSKAKKGMVYDFLHGNFNYYNGGTYQLYPVRHLEQDIQHCIDNNIHEALLSSEPIKTSEIKALWNVKDTHKSKINYNYKALGVPLLSKQTILQEIKWIM